MNARGNIIRGIIYLGLVAGLALLVIGKQHVIEGKRTQKIISVIDEWQSIGKPVIVRRVAVETVDEWVKISLIFIGTGFEGDVPRAIWKRLAKGQSVFLGEEKVPSGRIVDLGKAVDVATGLYHVKIGVEESIRSEGGLVLARVLVDQLKDVIVAPESSLGVEKGVRVVWTVVDGKAHEVMVSSSQEGSYGVVISEGLKTGDLLVVDGKSMLRENDKVSIREDGL